MVPGVVAVAGIDYDGGARGGTPPHPEGNLASYPPLLPLRPYPEPAPFEVPKIFITPLIFNLFTKLTFFVLLMF